MQGFGATMWQEIAPLYRVTLDHAFNVELGRGTLPRETFVFYMIQDAYYLNVFARALALLAAKAPTQTGQVTLARASAEAITVEQGLHRDYFSTFGITGEVFAQTPPSPTCEAYGDFLVAAGYGQPFAVGLAAVLPCFVIYWRVGQELYGQTVPGNPFQKWIDTYADPSFAALVRDVTALADEAHAQASPITRQRMAAAYQKASRYEWMFWDSAYRRESWPV